MEVDAPPREYCSLATQLAITDAVTHRHFLAATTQNTFSREPDRDFTQYVQHGASQTAFNLWLPTPEDTAMIQVVFNAPEVSEAHSASAQVTTTSEGGLAITDALMACENGRHFYAVADVIRIDGANSGKRQTFRLELMAVRELQASNGAVSHPLRLSVTANVRLVEECDDDDNDAEGELELAQARSRSRSRSRSR